MWLHKKTVFVGLSGGVDSAVTAGLLCRAGYKVVGVFIKNWSEQIPGVIECPWEEDYAAARQVAGHLGIPLYTFDFEADYKERVVDYFFREYEQGHTPNPDIMCNREIKFGLFLERARRLGADFIATGHYARVRRDWHGVYHLYRGSDANKDQSYFLYTLGQDQLRHVLFPLGRYTKPQVRQLAQKWGLPNADRKDSQGICFLGHVEVADFLRTRITPVAGPIMTVDGKEIGQHQGLVGYTIGQRRGIDIGGLDQPYYVVAKNHSQNKLIVAPGHDHPALQSRQIMAVDATWVGARPDLPMRCQAMIRYRQKPQACTIIGRGQQLAVNFKQPQWAVAPGQSVVFYHGDVLIGGATIAETVPIAAPVSPSSH